MGTCTCPKVDDLMECRVTSCQTTGPIAGSFVQFCLRAARASIS